MISIRTLIICGLLAGSLSFTTHAQERSAGGTTETQMTWSALKNLIDTARSESAAAHDRLDLMAACNKVKKVHAPGVSGADGNGCVTVTDISNITNCAKKNMLYDGTKCVDPLADINNCAKTGKIYNPTTKKCAAIAASTPVIKTFEAGGMYGYVAKNEAKDIGLWSACFISEFTPYTTGIVSPKNGSPVNSECTVSPASNAGADGTLQKWTLYKSISHSHCRVICLRYE